MLEIRIKLNKLLYCMNMGVVEPLSSKKVIFVFLRQLCVPNLDPVIPIITCNNDNCDPLSENPAHPAFYENRDKTGNRCIDVQLSSIEKKETIGCLVPELRSETHRGRGTQVFEKTQCFYVVTVNCNVSVYYRVT